MTQERKRMHYLKPLLFIQILLWLLYLNVNAQVNNIDTIKLDTPGPTNLETAKFATFYIIRPDGEVAKNFWLGIYFNNDQMVRVNDDMRYVIKYAGSGDVEVWTRNEQKTAVNIHVESGKTYYLQVTTIIGGKNFFPKIEQLNDADGKAAFDKIIFPPLYVYDPDPFTNGYYVWPDAAKVGYAHMKFTPPLSARHFFQSTIDGFIFSYYNKTSSLTFSEVVGVYGGKKNISDREDFLKFANKQMDNLKKSSSKTATIEAITEDSLTCSSDYIYSVYFIEKDSKPNVQVNGVTPFLEVRQYSSIVYKKDVKTGKGDYYSIYFSERGLPEELHSKEEIRFKIQRLLNSCEFGDFKEL
jgi:hypothetical protein